MFRKRSEAIDFEAEEFLVELFVAYFRITLKLKKVFNSNYFTSRSFKLVLFTVIKKCLYAMFYIALLINGY